ncbi:MAG: LysR family transcriptional regulator [Streptosporangiales bacterium]|nr:LysR family transcriptional regulator [Streptosporangiales bacterium]
MRRRAAQLASLDLNLVLVLRELIRERNVTRAADRLGVTQPAVSAALSRLRRHFGDELLVRDGRGYVLSPLAAQLRRQAEEICAAAEQLFSAGEDFDPGTARREFTLMMADYTVAVLGDRVSALFEERAPHASLHIRLAREALALEMPHLIQWVDGIVAPEPWRSLPMTRSAELFRDEWVCVMAAGHPLASAGPLTVSDLNGASWVLPFYRSQDSPLAPPATRQLAALGIRPKTAIGVESYLAVPALVSGTGRVALLQRRLADQFAGPLGLVAVPCPGEPEPIAETLWWHEDLDADPAHAWLRTELAALTAEL